MVKTMLVCNEAKAQYTGVGERFIVYSVLLKLSVGAGEFLDRETQ